MANPTPQPDVPAPAEHDELNAALGPDVMQTDVVETVRRAESVLGLRLGHPVDLGGSDRSRVLRCPVEGRSGGTVVIKHFLSDDGGHVREAVGLDLLDRTAELLARSADGRLLVMSDLGTRHTLADLLLGGDAEAAWAGARGWAHELGGMLGRSRTVVAQARLRLHRDLPHGAADDGVVIALRRGVSRLAELKPDLDAAAIESEFSGAGALLGPGAADVLWPTDTCPDNALLDDDGWWFVDLEGTDVGHAALAAAYTLLPFATCWCVFDPPPGLTDDLLAAFTTGLAAHAPDVVATPDWRHQVTVACATYIVLNTAWLIDSALEGRPNVGPAGRSPTYRQLVTSRWRWGALALRESLPALADTLHHAAVWASRMWGLDAETTGYPAFR
jgi:hypothetical protein